MDWMFVLYVVLGPVLFILGLILLIIFLAAIGIFKDFLKDSLKKRKKAREKMFASLEYYLGLKRDYKIYVSVKGLDNWQKIRSKSEIKTARLKNFCVCYSSGEILEIYSNVEKIPSDAHWIEDNRNEGLGFEEIAFDEVDLSQKEIEITNKVSKNPSGVYYETTITNKTGENIYPIAFGGYQKYEEKGAFVLDNVVDNAYSAEQFKSWYGLKRDFLASGESVSDPNNYGDGDGYWIFVFKTESGEIKTAGCFLRDLVIENMQKRAIEKALED